MYGSYAVCAAVIKGIFTFQFATFAGVGAGKFSHYEGG